MRAAISISSSLGVKSTRRLTKLKRTPRTPASCMACSSSSVTERLTVATPRALPPECTSASTMARLSAPWQVASAPGPNTWQCASTAPAGTWTRGLLGPAYQSSQPGVFVNSLMRVLLGFLQARRSVERHVGLADHVAKTLALVLDELVELRACGGELLVAKGLELLGHFGAGQGLFDVFADLVGHGGGQAGWHGDSVPARDGKVLGATRFGHGGHVGERGRALGSGKREQAQLASAVQRACGGCATQCKVDLAGGDRGVELRGLLEDHVLHLRAGGRFEQLRAQVHRVAHRPAAVVELAGARPGIGHDVAHGLVLAARAHGEEEMRLEQR